MIFNKKNLNGFSLTEILIVLGFILIIGTNFIINLDLDNQVANARDNKRKAHVNMIKTTFQEYYSKNNQTYPDCLDDSIAYIEECSQLFPDYLSSIPQDPSKEDKCYFIEISSIEGVIVKALCTETSEEIKVGQ